MNVMPVFLSYKILIFSYAQVYFVLGPADNLQASI